jgi:XTP/dITP diphosphohydrolase
MPDVEESGDSFEENALLKARALTASSGCWALADDSGLEVDALGGAPGIRSARFAGDNASDGDNVTRLLDLLRAVPPPRRSRFRCVLALAGPDGQSLTADGTLEGEIARQPQGDGGFGYDPVFFLSHLNRTVAELGLEEKQKISHRARAAGNLLRRLPEITL